MIKLFILDNYECKVNKDEVYLIPEFKSLFELNYNKQEGDADGRRRKRANAELTYMYFMHAYGSEYREYDEDERHTAALESAGLLSDYELSDQLKQACAKFNELQETRMLKLLRAAEKAVDKTRKFFENISYDEVNNAGNLKYEPAKIMATITGLAKVEESLAKLEAKVKLDLGSTPKNRGDQEEGRIK